MTEATDDDEARAEQAIEEMVVRIGEYDEAERDAVRRLVRDYREAIDEILDRLTSEHPDWDAQQLMAQSIKDLRQQFGEQDAGRMMLVLALRRWDDREALRQEHAD